MGSHKVQYWRYSSKLVSLCVLCILISIHKTLFRYDNDTNNYEEENEGEH